MTENEKKVLNVLAHSEELSKKDIAAALGVSWATVVKITKRLEQDGLITFAGRPERKNIQGVDSAVFRLASDRPVAVGVDVGYRQTVMTVVNLRNDILWRRIAENPVFADIQTLATFLKTEIGTFLSGLKIRPEGIGIGVPAFILPSESDISHHLAELLTTEIEIPLCVDRNIRGYALYKRFATGISGDFATVAVRTGIGLAVILNNVLYRGESNLAGEISHIPVSGPNALCRCGQRGCLETCINREILARDYQELLTKRGRRVFTNPVSSLMTLAAKGDSDALAILEKRTRPLAQALVSLLLILDIHRIIIAGQFGKDGAVFTNMISTALESMISIHIPYQILYEELQPLDFAIGASHLILQRFYS